MKESEDKQEERRSIFKCYMNVEFTRGIQDVLFSSLAVSDLAALGNEPKFLGHK